LKTVKGQASLIDLVIGFSVFMLIFVLVIGAINSNYKDITKNREIDEIEHSANFVLKELTETKGFPENWETLGTGEIQRIGLTEKNNQISEEKLVAFSNLDYDESKVLMKLEGYDYYFDFDGIDNITAGLNPIGQTKYEITMKKIVEYKGSEAEIEFKVYILWE